MAIIFDAATKRIILGSANVTATEIYSRWVDWLATADNAKYGLVIRQVGGDDLGDGLAIPPYYFLQGAWRVRPMEAGHTLTLTGNLFVDGGGDPFAPTLGVFNVLIKSVVPVQAQAFSTAGGAGPSLTVEQITAGIWNAMAAAHQTNGTMGQQVQAAALNAALAAALSA